MMFPIVVTLEMELIMPAYSRNIASGMNVVFSLYIEMVVF